ncbi:BglG family transcription antiterminator [Ornithinibacillus contaminans]|uniref:BglG family transcription antiterminator n=1 Tax=Ornithinibacillus contaminans TaxID=694055 RepID=UPI00064E09AB|nr:BglG family transcription antiterminator [Ornithinibacillus contaminans]
MVLSDRSKKILDELTSNPSITSVALEKKFDLTRRQLGYTMDKINDWLIRNDLPIIERTRQGHFVIDQAVFTKLSGSHENVTTDLDNTILKEEQRAQLIMMMILSSEEELSLNHFTYELNVSKNTVLNDLKQVQAYVEKFDLSLRYSRKLGYLIEGKEFQIRNLLMNVTYHMLQMNNGEKRLRDITGIHQEKLTAFKQRVEGVENQLSLKFTDEKLQTMPYILILILRRIQKGFIIDNFAIGYEELANTKEYKATEDLLHNLEDIPVSERLFITLHLLTTNVFSSEISAEEVIPDLLPAIDNVLRHFEKSACIYLQDREQLLDKLMQHIKPAYYRIKYQLTDTILFQGSLSKEFKEIHHLVKRSIGPLRELVGKDIPDNEIAYITMLIGGWMNKHGESIEKKVKAIVVCPQGVSVSRLMFNELQELFPEFVFLDYLSVREFLKYPLDFDVIFSPINLETDKKLFVTKVFLGREEKYRLRKQVMLGLHGYVPEEININKLLEIISNHTTIHDKKALAEALVNYLNPVEDSQYVKQNLGEYINLNELINLSSITTTASVASWDDAIRLSAKSLLDQEKIEARYVDAMIQYCEKDSYIVIAPGIAIPHAAPEDGALEVGMSLLQIKDGVTYLNDYRIHVIIAISAVDKQQHIHALMQLMNLVGSERERNKLIQANSPEEIYDIIEHYSKDLS